MAQSQFQQDGFLCLGAIIAGGKSRRFGSDKALALVDGRPMLDHVADALAAQVDEMVICGKEWRSWPTLADYPVADFGPLGGLCAALDHASTRGYGAVLTAPVDVLPVPGNLLALLAGETAAVFGRQHLIGYWPVGYRDALVAHILSGGGRAFRAWLDSTDARRIEEPMQMHNVNRQEDLPPAA
jgi:molybdopterin-guanine dinucleotide biosynthesis protein A